MEFQDLDFLFTTIVVGDDFVTNGAMTGNTGNPPWTLGDGWTLPGTTAVNDASQGADSDLGQTPVTALVEGYNYQTTFTTSGISGAACTMVIGGTEGTGRTTDATFVEIIAAGSGALIQVQADATTAVTVDNVTVFAVDGVAQIFEGGAATVQITAGSFGSGKVNPQVSFDGGLRYVKMKDTDGKEIFEVVANVMHNIELGPCLIRFNVVSGTITTGQAKISTVRIGIS